MPVKCLGILRYQVDGNRIKSLRDATKKMSKSEDSVNSRIDLIDEPDFIMKKIKKAVTDFTPEVYFDEEKRPGVSNLLTIHSMLTNKPIDDICKESEGLDTGKYKLHLAEIIIEKLKPIRSRYLELIKQPDFLINVLDEGAERAKVEAEISMNEVYNKIGFSLDSKEMLTKSTVRQ